MKIYLKNLVSKINSFLKDALKKLPNFFVKASVSWKDFVHRHLVGILFSTTLVVVSVVVLFPLVYVRSPAGHAGVLYRVLAGGTDFNFVLGEGANFILPWNKVTVYDMRALNYTVSAEVITSDRLLATITYSTQWQLYYNTLPLFHKSIGPDYKKIVLEPIVAGVIRQIYSGSTAGSAFTTGSEENQQKIVSEINQKLLKNVNPSGLDNVNTLQVTGFNLIKVAYSTEVEKALEQKAIELSKAESYEYRIEAAKQEALRKKIEAKGISEFQDTVRAGLTDSYLKYIGIQATENLAKSENSKVVVFGGGPNGLPIIFNDADKVNPKK
jgi:regulator of protease activity HflC (stomatin/prohibitin superfamily)